MCIYDAVAKCIERPSSNLFQETGDDHEFDFRCRQAIKHRGVQIVRVGVCLCAEVNRGNRGSLCSFQCSRRTVIADDDGHLRGETSIGTRIEKGVQRRSLA